MSVAVLIDRTLRAFDRIRLASFKLTLRSEWLSSLLVRRDSRLTLTVGVHAGAAAVLAVHYPVLLFVLAPVVFGVMHVAADVRYLVLRRELAASWRGIVFGASVLLFGGAALSLSGVVRVPARFDVVLLVLWSIAGVAAGLRRGEHRLRASLGLAGVGLVGACALAWPLGFRALFAHAHNLIALAVWPLFHRRRTKARWLVMLAIVGVAILMASGSFYRASLASPGAHQFGIHVLGLANALSPVDRADRAAGIVSAFVFLQAVHYAIWLSVVPQAEQPGQGTLSFRQTLRGLVADFGPLNLGLVALAALGVLALALVRGPLSATTSYMQLALFHGYLELVLLLYFWVSGVPLVVRPADARRRSG